MKLTKSQRVKVIQDIAAQLSPENWSITDLTLKQFGLPTSDQWSGDSESYVVEMIKDSEDSDLVELGKHFGMQFEEAAGATSSLSGPATSYWKDGYMRAFISHLTDERKQAADLQTSLERFGISGFVAHNDINPTLEWQTEIETALSTCDVLIALIHPNFVSSKWCDQEVGYALGRGIPVFTVRCGADPHGFVSRFQAFNGNGKQPLQIARELFDAAFDHKKLQSKMADLTIDLFANSGSFAVAKERMALVERLKIWDSSYTVRLKKAVFTNSQINGSWGVPSQVEAILKKWS